MKKNRCCIDSDSDDDISDCSFVKEDIIDIRPTEDPEEDNPEKEIIIAEDDDIIVEDDDLEILNKSFIDETINPRKSTRVSIVKEKKEPKKPKIKWSTKYQIPSQNTFVYGLDIPADSIELYSNHTVLKNWYTVPISQLSENEIQKISSELLVVPSNVDYVTKEELPPISMFHKNEYCIFVPPYYGIKRWGVPEYDFRKTGDDIQHTFSEKYFMLKKLRQDEAYESIMNKLKSIFGSAYLGLPPGGGKTVVALKGGSDLGRVIGVIGHKDFLINQWKDRGTQYLPGVKIGIVQSDTIEFEGCDIILFMLHTVLYHLDDPVLHKAFNKCGTIIIDEARHINAKEFSKILPILTGKYMLALDGTPDKSNTSMVLHHWIGPVTFQIKRDYDFRVRVKVLDIPYSKPKAKFMINKDYNRGRMITDLSLVKERNEGIADELSVIATTGDQTLVLSERVEHLKVLEAMLKKRVPDASAGQFESGISKKRERMLLIESKQFIFATFAMAAEALDIPTLRRLVYTIGKPNAEQSSARIMRGTSAEEPWIYDVYDKWSFWADYYETRHRFFRNEGFEIEYPTKELAEVNMVRGVKMFERDGRFVLKKDIKKSEKRKITEDNENNQGTDDVPKKPRTKCPFGVKPTNKRPLKK